MSENDDKLEFDFERISILYANTATGYFGMGAAGSCMAYLIWRMSSLNLALIWLGALFVAYLPRVVLSTTFSKRVRDGRIDKTNIAPWEKYFFFGSIAPFLCFASAVFIPYGDNSLLSLMYYSTAAMALLAGGILAYSTSLPAILLFLNLAMLPVIFMIFMVDNIVATIMGVTLAISYVLLIRLIPRQNRVLLENIALKIENRSQSLTDPLTSLSNRRSLQLHMENLIPVSRRQGEPFSIIMLDIDHFKNYNDTHGHSAGDELLVKVAEILRECCRDQDLVVRYGGEEFLLVLPSTNVEAAKILAERIGRSIREQTDVTVSAGLAMHSDALEFDELIRAADKKLYSAKASGRDAYIA